MGGRAALRTGEEGLRGEERGRVWAEVFRRAPIGVLVLGALLFFVGAGFVMGGVFFVVIGVRQHWPAWLVLLAVGPVAIYVALGLVLLRPRAWLIVVMLLVLLLASSAVRAIVAGGVPVSPVLEIAAAGFSLGYLCRPRVKGAFGV